MPTLSKKQWQQIELRLSSNFGDIELLADGYRLQLQVHPYKALRNCIVVYVDGVSKGAWYKGDCPEAKKFCRPSKHWLYSAKRREEAAKALKKRGLNSVLKEFYKSVAESFFVHWEPYWFSPASLTRHLRKTCADVEIVRM